MEGFFFLFQHVQRCLLYSSFITLSQIEKCVHISGCKTNVSLFKSRYIVPRNTTGMDFIKKWAGQTWQAQRYQWPKDYHSLVVSFLQYQLHFIFALLEHELDGVAGRRHSALKMRTKSCDKKQKTTCWCLEHSREGLISALSLVCHTQPWSALVSKRETTQLSQWCYFSVSGMHFNEWIAEVQFTVLLLLVTKHNKLKTNCFLVPLKWPFPFFRALDFIFVSAVPLCKFV